MDRGLFFFHNPKASGTAVAAVVEPWFAPEARAPLIENTQREHERLRGDYARFAGYAYYGGHYGRDVFDAVADGHAAITNFRQPWARLLSLYNYYRLIVTLPEDAAALDELHPVAVAQRVGFRDFVSTDDPRVEIHTRNYHVRQLSGSAWNPDSVGDLAQATALVDQMAWFYVCERQVASERWGRQVFGKRFGAVPRANVTGRGTGAGQPVVSVDDATRRIIDHKNRLDCALYDHAVRRLSRRSFLGRLSLGWTTVGRTR